MIDSNVISYLVMAFSLGVCLGVSLLVLASRSRGEKLLRELEQQGFRVSNAAGERLGLSELTRLMATSPLSAGSGAPVQRLGLIAICAAGLSVAVVLVVQLLRT
jgi:hypothetical protein